MSLDNKVRLKQLQLQLRNTEVAISFILEYQRQHMDASYLETTSGTQPMLSLDEKHLVTEFAKLPQEKQEQYLATTFDFLDAVTASETLAALSTATVHDEKLVLPPRQYFQGSTYFREPDPSVGVVNRSTKVPHRVYA